MIAFFIAVAVLAVLVWAILLLSFKCGYYKQTLINHRDKFTEERFKSIEEVMNKKTPF